MELQFGVLSFSSALEHADLLAPIVAQALRSLSSVDEIGVAEIDPAFSDTAAFCKHYGVEMNTAANCVVLEAKRGERIWYAACVILATTRADVNGLARRALDARRVSFAPMEKAIAETGMEYGAITPIGLPHDLPILIDAAVVDSERVIVGSGVRRSKLLIPGAVLASLPSAQVLEDLGMM
jgi:prolyl-tRNA editing enzyme YbaK/EbsC (Cys-tRNA(Pro) deacylase)